MTNFHIQCGGADVEKFKLQVWKPEDLDANKVLAVMNPPETQQVDLVLIVLLMLLGNAQLGSTNP